MKTIRIPLQDDNYDITDSYIDCYIKNQNKNLRAKVDYPAMIVCPGGGYMELSDRESEIVALNFAAQGYHVFVLNYSLLPADFIYPKPLIEMAKVFELIDNKKNEYHINTKRIGMIGFSAGGHVVSLYNGTPDNWIRNYTDASIIKPYRQILGYPLIDYNLINNDGGGDPEKVLGDYNDGAAQKKVTSNTPPTFIWSTNTDEVVDIQNTLSYIQALKDNHVNYEAHIFGWGPHGLSLSTEQTNYLPTDQKHADRNFLNPHVQAWFPLVLEWLNQDHFGIK